jgi:hypothetical protein
LTFKNNYDNVYLLINLRIYPMSREQSATTGDVGKLPQPFKDAAEARHIMLSYIDSPNLLLYTFEQMAKVDTWPEEVLSDPEVKRRAQEQLGDPRNFGTPEERALYERLAGESNAETV